MAIFYIADTHFNHSNIIGFDNRPFSSVDEMNETLIHNWNSVVKRGDQVYILGDFCWSRDENVWISILQRLNGQKFLIRGNHDPKHVPGRLAKCFAQVCDYKEIKDCGTTVIMSHFPMLFYKHDYRPNTVMLYGHVHKTKENQLVQECLTLIREKDENFWDKAPKNLTQMYNVGCMMPWMNYTPRTLSELLSKAK